jgi:hypothetical protein
LRNPFDGLTSLAGKPPDPMNFGCPGASAPYELWPVTICACISVNWMRLGGVDQATWQDLLEYLAIFTNQRYFRPRRSKGPGNKKKGKKENKG